jgi:dTDP-4-amino-4,6-dideoxygalactose transaminase
VVADGAQPVWHLFVVRSPERDRLQAHLKAAGIGTLVHYPVAPHLQKAYREMGLGEGTYPLTEAIHREVLSLPIGPHLASEDAARVVEAVQTFAREWH